MIHISISPILKKKLPNLALGCITIDVNIKPLNPDIKIKTDTFIANYKKKVSAEIIREIPTVKATKEAYRILGKDPNRYRPSAEALLRRVANGKGLYSINNVVDTLNLLSIKSGHSICGYDLEKIDPVVILDIGKKGEPYEGIGRGPLNIENLPVFRDAHGAFGTPTSDSVRTMVTENTKKFLMIFMDFLGTDDLMNILEEARRQLQVNTHGSNVQCWICK